MDEILDFLREHGAFLCGEGYEIEDSLVADSFGDAYVVLQSDRLRLRLVRDRGQLFLDFQGLEREREADWFSIDIVRRWLTGVAQVSAELDEGSAVFLEERLADIESQFSGAHLSLTEKALRTLEGQRAKEVFG